MVLVTHFQLVSFLEAGERERGWRERGRDEERETGERERGWREGGREGKRMGIEGGMWEGGINGHIK